MSGKTSQDDQQRLATEWGTVWPILMASGDKATIMLAQVSSVLGAPLHRYFENQVTRAIAVALDAAVRGEIKPSCDAATQYLSGLPQETLIEIVSGKPVSPWKKLEYEGSVLLAVGGFSVFNPPAEVLPSLIASAKATAQVLKHLYDRKFIIEGMRALAKNIAACNLKNGPSLVFREGVESLSREIGGVLNGRTMGDCFEAAVNQGQNYDELRASGRENPCSWGIPELDKLAPMRPGQLIVLSAGPGAGKTSLALQAMSATAARGGRDSVANCSLEMQGEDLALILACRELGIAVSAIREWTDLAKRMKPEINALIQQWKESSTILIRDLSGGDAQTIQAITAWYGQRQALSQNRLGLCVLDYIGLIDGAPRENEYTTITKATKQLKRSAMAMRLPILCLAQMNREGRKAEREKGGEVGVVPEPRLEDLKSSGSLEQDADMVVFIHLPDIRKVDAGSVLNGKIIVAKQRGGATGSIDIAFHRRQQLFQSLFVPEHHHTDRMSAAPSESEDYFNA